ncbi:hypothetical protein J3E61_004562 [Mycobacterium sp. OAE908]
MTLGLPTLGVYLQLLISNATMRRKTMAGLKVTDA